jgi:hypothetical protein
MQRGMYVQYLGRLEVRDICGGAVVWCAVSALSMRESSVSARDCPTNVS